MSQPCSLLHRRSTATHAAPEHCRLSLPAEADALEFAPPGQRPLSPPRPQLIWTPKLPVDLRDTVSAPPQRGRGDSARHDVTLPPPAATGVKRSPSSTPPPVSARDPLHKRRRLQGQPRHCFDRCSFAQTPQFQRNGQPPSPLFFSSRNTRPQLPARFSSSEAASRMLSKTREESGIKTVTLARGTFSGLSPPGPNGVPSIRSADRSSLPRTSSPDAREKTDPLRLLGSVGIAEFLEQDGRPTFIVDIGDAANYAPESCSLQILFANNALRSSSSMWELVAGKPSESITDEYTAHPTTQFRGWLLSTVAQDDSVEVNPSPVEHGGIVWSCYTLRKRLRVVTGAVPLDAAITLPSTDAGNEFSIPSASSVGLISGSSVKISSPNGPVSEPQDYFGTGVPVVVQEEPTPPLITSPSRPKHIKEATSHPSSSEPRNSSNTHAQTLEDLSHYHNESVLRAHSAGDIDAFYREENFRIQDHDMGFFDWTRLPISSSLPKHIAFARSIDWASTPLGPIEYWSNDLRAMCNLIM